MTETPEELIAAALAEPDDSDERWAHIHALRQRGDRATLEAAIGLLASGDWERRQTGVDILAQLSYDDPEPLQEEIMVALLDHHVGETSPDVIDSLGHAF